MAEQFIIRTELTDAIATNEAFSLVNSATNQYIDLGAAVSIFNEVGSDCVVRVKSIEINELVARTVALPTQLTLTRITALTGGENITPIKFDSNDSDLPALVLCVKNAGSTTVTGASFRNQLSYLNNSETGALRGLATPLFGKVKDAIGSIYTVHDTNVQNITLRANEGISITTGSSANQNYPLEFRITLNNGTATYLISEIINVSANPNLISIYNTTGSGITALTISRIEITQVKNDAILPVFSVETISGCYDGKDITPIKLDTANTTIPSGVKIKKNCTVTQSNVDASQFPRKKTTGDLPIRRVVMSPFGVSPALASGLIANLKIRQKVFDFSTVADSDGGMILREGDGLAIMQKTNLCAWGNYEVIITLTNVYTPSGGGGGEHSYTFVN